jgi:leucyl/phenylalanyl-tRNA--protein transferase
MFLSLFNKSIRPDPLHILWNCALGYMPDFLDLEIGRVGWVRRSHRGVNRLDNIQMPDRQRRYVMSKKFELRINAAFEECIRACADVSRSTIQKRLGKTYLTEDLIQGFLKLREMGHAHSFEAWHEGKLAGGVFGIQIGSFVSWISMFYRVSHASKAALGRGLLHLRERGFEIVDRGAKPDHSSDYGVQWWPRWKYEAEVLRLCRIPRSIIDGQAPTPLPPILERGLPLVRVGRAIGRRIWPFGPRLHQDPADAGSFELTPNHVEAGGSREAGELQLAGGQSMR